MLNLNKMLNPLHSSSENDRKDSVEVEETYDALNKLQQSHALIYVSLGQHSQNTYQSIILDVDAETATIAIDELFPSGLALKTGDQVSVTIRESTQHSLTFNTRVKAQQSEAGQTSYVLSLPSYLDAHQRREAFRLAVRGKASWEENDFSPVHAKVKDISISGVKLTMPEAALQVGNEIEDCELKFSSLNLTCDLKVTRIDNSEHPEMVTVGARMLTLGAAEKRKLEQFLMQQQRQNRLNGGL